MLDQSILNVELLKPPVAVNNNVSYPGIHAIIHLSIFCCKYMLNICGILL